MKSSSSVGPRRPALSEFWLSPTGTPWLVVSTLIGRVDAHAIERPDGLVGADRRAAAAHLVRAVLLGDRAGADDRIVRVYFDARFVGRHRGGGIVLERLVGVERKRRRQLLRARHLGGEIVFLVSRIDRRLCRTAGGRACFRVRLDLFLIWMRQTGIRRFGLRWPYCGEDCNSRAAPNDELRCGGVLQPAADASVCTRRIRARIAARRYCSSRAMTYRSMMSSVGTSNANTHQVFIQRPMPTASTQETDIHRVARELIRTGDHQGRRRPDRDNTGVAAPERLEPRREQRRARGHQRPGHDHPGRAAAERQRPGALQERAAADREHVGDRGRKPDARIVFGHHAGQW